MAEHKIGYARVSTQDQDPALQLDALKKAGCERIFQEKASGAQRDRPQLMAALDYLREGDTLVVWKLDRLARSMKQLIETVEALGERGVGFQSLTENIDTTSPSGRLVFHIFASLAEFERSIIRERTLAGLAAARSQGRQGGRPKAMSDDDRQMVESLLRDTDIPLARIAKQTGVAVSTIYKEFPGGRGALRESASA